MNTNNSDVDSVENEDILEGIFDSNEEHPEEPADVTPNIKSYLAIDERFKNLAPEEALARTIQSKEEYLKGKLKAEIDRAEEMSTQVRFLNELKTNPELRQAWLSEVDPDYSNDIDSQVTKVLQKEFKDFTPNNEEKDDPSSPTAKYYRRWNALYDKFENNQSTKTVKEILALNEKNANKAQQQLEKNIKRIQEEEKWDKDTMSEFLNFAQKFDIFAVKKVFKYKLTNPTRRPPTGKPGSSGIVHPDKMSAEVTSKFGKPKSGKLKKS